MRGSYNGGRILTKAAKLRNRVRQYNYSFYGFEGRTAASPHRWQTVESRALGLTVKIQFQMNCSVNERRNGTRFTISGCCLHSWFDLQCLRRTLLPKLTHPPKLSHPLLAPASDQPSQLSNRTFVWHCHYSAPLFTNAHLAYC